MTNKLVHGVGINNADYDVVKYKYKEGKRVQFWQCPYYLKWYSMLMRCYSKKFQENNPTYEGCAVCKEWLYFSNFIRWMESQEWEGRCLDKDFLVEGNKVYSETTCVFIPNKVNTFLTARGNGRGEYPLGVNLKKDKKKNPYQSNCNDGSGKWIYLGYFSTPEQAHQAWLTKKLEICERYLIEFKDEPLTVKGLLRIRDKLHYHIDTGTELILF